MRSEELRRSIEKLESLPSPSFSLNRILELASDSESNIEQLAESVESDPAVTARVLRLANSAYFGVSGDVDNVGRAIMVVGYNSVLSLATCAALAPAFQGNDPRVDRKALWLHSCATSEASRLVAARVGEEPATGHAAGLLHDLGVVVLSEVLGEAYGGAIEKATEPGASLPSIESESFGLDHSDAAEILFGRWKLPPRLIEAVAKQHRPERDGSRLASVVGLADHLAARCGFPGPPGDDLAPAAVASLSRALRLDAASTDELARGLEERREAIELLAGAGAPQ